MRQMHDEQIKALIEECRGIEDRGEALAADATSMALYLEGVLANPEVTERQLQRLAARAAGGSERAREQFVQASQRMLLATAVDLGPAKAPLLDLVQEGNMALLGTLGEGVSDLSELQVAANAGMQGLVDEVGDGAARIPAHLAEVVGEYVAVRQHLLDELGHEPSDAQLAEHMDQPVALIEEAKAFLDELE